MRLNLSTSWIFRGWITCLFFIFCTQNAVQSKSLQCDRNQYLRGSKCCDKCGPGYRLYEECSDSEETKCRKCVEGEYQPGWTVETGCLKQKFCDPGKGFTQRPENIEAEEPCRCIPNFQCSQINCEYCERIPTCKAGEGLEADPDSVNGRRICVACKKGFFSDDISAEPCKPWTNCKSEGRAETRPGSTQADTVCGPHVSAVAAPSWVIVSVLSVITVLCLLILLLFCYKDKLKLLSVNLRSCVQNLKRTRIQQETLAPLYHSGGAGGVIVGPGGSKCTPCVTSKLTYPVPNNSNYEHQSIYPTPVPCIQVSLPLTGETTQTYSTKERLVNDKESERCGGPEEVSEETVDSASPLLAGSCVCAMPVREPLEVGENEDCSQAVSAGTQGTCFCGGLDGDEKGKEKKGEGEKKGDGDQEKVISSKNETAVESLISVSPPLLRTSPVIPPSSPNCELCVPLSQAQTRPEFKLHPLDRSPVISEELRALTSTDSASTKEAEPISTSTVTLFKPLMTTSSVGDLYLDKPSESSSQEQGQGLSLRDSGGGNKLSSGNSELECPPESLHSQLAEPALTSGQVSGNHNTTFISSGQVMNFSGEVIVVYVSQTSLGSNGSDLDDAFGSPVQEEANETAPLFQSSLRSQGDFLTHNTLQEETLPVQEVMNEWPQRK